ncbi:D-serine dehydratase, partial [Vibrio vulnificus]|nr:D-serine dehydratase [Vibrio vulnificus]
MTTNIDQLTEQYPLVKELIELKEISWFNPSITNLEEGLPYVGLGAENIQDASGRLKRFAPY